MIAGHLLIHSRLRGRAACLGGRQWQPVFPDRCLCFATLGLLDFVLTCFILSLGGGEANEIALWVMRHYGLAGAAIYKGGLVAFVIGLINWIAPRDLPAARRLANYALIVGAVPVLFAMMLLGLDALLMPELASLCP